MVQIRYIHNGRTIMDKDKEQDDIIPRIGETMKLWNEAYGWITYRVGNVSYCYDWKMQLIEITIRLDNEGVE